jgi:hypothetical protein
VFAFEAGAGALRAASAGVSLVVAKRAFNEEEKLCMRGFRGYESRRAESGLRERERGTNSTDDWSWIVRLRGECSSVRAQHVGCGLSLVWSGRKLEEFVGESCSHVGADRRRRRSRKKRKDAENKQQSTPALR